jgi:GH25 family lysozyme M1 (1,4-beta-N-acetylmuramidase)
VQHVQRAPAAAIAPKRSRRVMRSIALPLSTLLLFVAVGGATAAPRAGDPRLGTTPNPGATGYLEGIDISHWQGTIDWKKVAAAGKKFAIMKATEDIDFVDNKYAINRSGAAAAGVRTTAYHFAQPDSSLNDAIEEADHFVNTARLAAGDIVPALDLEVSGGLSATALTKWVKTWLDRVNSRLDVKAMVYVSPAFWKKYLADTQSIATAGYTVLWIAHWGVSAPTVAASNWAGHGWTFWQYSNCGSVPGIAGCVDLDRFNGTDLTRATYEPGFRLSISRSSVTVKQGSSASASVGIVRSSVTNAVAFTVSGLPAGAKASFSPTSTTGTSSTLTLSASRTSTITPTGTYTVTIAGEGGGLVRTVTTKLVVTDGIGPVMATPGVRLYSGGTLGNGSTPVRSTWTASDPSGIKSYQVQRQVNGGTWTTISSATTAALINQQLSFSGTYRYRVRATDKLGNVGSWATGPAIDPSLSEQSNTTVHYTGTWKSVASTTASGGSTRYTTTAGASVSQTFSGSAIAWVAPKGPSRGSADVYVDGVYVAGVNLYASTSTPKVLVFAKWWPVNGTHTIKVVARGTAGHPRVDLDAFVRIKRS